MAMTINTNVASLNAQRNLGQTQDMLQTSLQRLSSGLRINSAKDDAAGMAIANRMTSQVRGLDQAVRNANDGISLAQTAEGALQESTNLLQRIRELALQSSSDGSTDTDRASMQVEVDQLVAELDRIADTTSFNGKVLLDGSFGTGNFQVGANANQIVSMSMNSAKTNALGATGGTATGNYTMAKETSSAGSLVTSGEMATLEASGLTLNGTEIRAARSGDDTVSSSDNAGSSLAIAAAINASSDKTGVTAYADKTTVDVDIALAAADVVLLDGDFKINGISIISTGAIADVDAMEALINEYSDQTGVTASNTAGTVTFTAVDGRNIQFTGDGAIATGTDFDFGGTDLKDTSLDQTTRGTVSLYSNESFTIGGTSPGTAGLTAGTVALDEKHWTDIGTLEALSAGDLVINGYSVIAPSATGDQDGDTQSHTDTVEAASAKAIAYAINNTDGLKTEVTATAKTVANLGTVSSETSDALVLTINGTTITLNQDIEADDANGFIVGTMNAAFAAAAADTAGHGLVASLNSDNELIITSDTGVNIDVDVATASTNSSAFSAIDTTDDTVDVVHKGTISLEAKTGYTLESVEGGKKALAGIETAVGSIENVDISTYQGAQNAITAVDGALSQIDDQRAELGAIQNRFDSTIANLSTTSENLSAAKARIMDADFAAETANLTKAQILQQAGTAMLAQANMLPQTVLSLLQ